MVSLLGYPSNLKDLHMTCQYLSRSVRRPAEETVERARCFKFTQNFGLYFLQEFFA